MTFETSEDACVVRVEIEDRLDLDTADAFRERSEQFVRNGSPLLVTFREGSFADSTGIWTLLQLVELGRRHQEGEGVAIVSRSRSVDQVLEMTRLPEYVPIAESEDHATALLAS